MLDKDIEKLREALTEYAVAWSQKIYPLELLTTIKKILNKNHCAAIAFYSSTKKLSITRWKIVDLTNLERVATAEKDISTFFIVWPDDLKDTLLDFDLPKYN